MRKYIPGIAFLVITAGLFFLPFRKRTETLQLWYFPGNSYAPTNELAPADEQGKPKVVLVRKVGQMDCYDVFYSQKLQQLLGREPSKPVNVTYRVNYRFGKLFWIETLDVAGLGIEPITSRSISGSVRTGDVAPRDCY
jgi:hypothetical protein